MQVVKKFNLTNSSSTRISLPFSQKCLTVDLILAVTPDFWYQIRFYIFSPSTSYLPSCFFPWILPIKMDLNLISPFNTQIYQKTILWCTIVGSFTLKLQYEQFKSGCTVSLLLHNLDIYYIVGRAFLFPFDTVQCPV